MDSYEQQVQARGEQSQADIRALRLPRHTEELMLDGARRSTRSTVTALHPFVEREKRSVSSLKTLIKFIDKHAASLQPVGGQVAFTDSALQAEYESMLTELNAESAPP
jgi:hypothetical protein